MTQENPLHTAAKMVYADAQGQLYDHPHLVMVGNAGRGPEAIPSNELVPVPRGSDFFTLPGRQAVGIDPDTGKLEIMEGPYTAVSVFLAPAWVRLRHPVYHGNDDAPILPLYAYCALGFSGDQFVTAGVRVDPEARQDPWLFDLSTINANAEQRCSQSPDNQMIQQLHRCAIEYGCRAAQNYFLGRWEAPLPTSEGCNAACLGCISLQPPGSCEAAQERVVKAPSAEEIAEVALEHIHRLDRAVVSFGQGCEGEPLLRGDVLVESIRLIRQQTDKGTIHLNSNASLPMAVDRMCQAGLQSLRISMNSAVPDTYNRYYRPRSYSFDDVQESGRTIKRHGGFLSLNLLVFPGVNDTEPELQALERFIDDLGVDMVQMRNLNVDPEAYTALLGADRFGSGVGLVVMMQRLRDQFPTLRFGYFNPPHQSFADPPEPVPTPATY
jgi:wyosine [tRNA(Phe)-imidazoG37] synthetase (radical SAM superfamily)